jgi:hypothetical protein
MKSTAAVFAVVATFTLISAMSAPSAYAKKLDLASIQGKYEFLAEPNCSLACPEGITVVYDEANATLDSEAFHFSNIGRRASADTATTNNEDPNHSLYGMQWVETRVTSNSLIQTDGLLTTTSNTSTLPMDPGPFEAPTPGSAEGMHLVDSSNSYTIQLKYDAKRKILRKTVQIDGQDAEESCAYQAAQ